MITQRDYMILYRPSAYGMLYMWINGKYQQFTTLPNLIKRVITLSGIGTKVHKIQHITTFRLATAFRML